MNKDYWKQREKEQGKNYVNYCGFDEAQNDDLVRERTEFFKKHGVFSKPTVDYGCGTGQYSQNFKKYFGLDLFRSEFFKGSKMLVLLSGKITKAIADKIKGFDQIFCSTVLNHCEDKDVVNIIMSWKMLKPKQVALYECMDPKLGRSSDWYQAEIDKLGLKLKTKESHVVHGVEHTLCIYGK